MRKNFKQLTREQRIKIEAYHNLKMSVKEIAEHVGCHFTTIYRELKRGKTTKISGMIGRIRKYTVTIWGKSHMKLIRRNVVEKGFCKMTLNISSTLK